MKTFSKGKRKKKTLGDKKLSHGMSLCNICGSPFKHHSAFERFCNSCRNHSKVFMFSEWMPETGVSL